MKSQLKQNILNIRFNFTFTDNLEEWRKRNENEQSMMCTWIWIGLSPE